MDMSAAYREAVAAHLPKAAIVCEHFHVIEPFNDKLSDLRRSLYHEANGDGKEVLKGARWLLLKAPENLDPERDEAERLEAALRPNRPLAVAYDLKEDLRQFWEQPGKRFATAFLNSTAGSGGRRPPASGCSNRWPRRWRPTAPGCWRTTPTRSAPARRRGPTTRSRR